MSIIQNHTFPLFYFNRVLVLINNTLKLAFFFFFKGQKRNHRFKVDLWDWIWSLCFSRRSHVTHSLLFLIHSTSLHYPGFILDLLEVNRIGVIIYPPTHTHTHLGCSRQTLPTWLERLTPCQDISHPGQESTLADFLSYAKVLDPACEKSPGHHLKACFSWKALRFLQVARVTQTLREECRKLGVNYRTNMGSIWQFVNLAIWGQD